MPAKPSKRKGPHERHQTWLKNLKVHGVEFSPKSGLVPEKGWRDFSVVKKPRRPFHTLFMRSGDTYKLSGRNKTGSRVVVTVQVGKDSLIKKVSESVVEFSPTSKAFAPKRKV